MKPHFGLKTISQISKSPHPKKTIHNILMSRTIETKSHIIPGQGTTSRYLASIFNCSWEGSCELPSWVVVLRNSCGAVLGQGQSNDNNHSNVSLCYVRLQHWNVFPLRPIDFSFFQSTLILRSVKCSFDAKGKHSHLEFSSLAFYLDQVCDEIWMRVVPYMLWVSGEVGFLSLAMKIQEILKMFKNVMQNVNNLMLCWWSIL